jgi:NAD(P)-dependent dehydrogenase (short-subunit alcohol dehydrogenase family)
MSGSGRMNGKVALVTGAARGTGEAHARRLALEGASVILADVLDAQGEASPPGSARTAATPATSTST